MLGQLTHVASISSAVAAVPDEELTTVYNPDLKIQDNVTG